MAWPKKKKIVILLHVKYHLILVLIHLDILFIFIIICYYYSFIFGHTTWHVGS